MALRWRGRREEGVSVLIHRDEGRAGTDPALTAMEGGARSEERGGRRPAPRRQRPRVRRREAGGERSQREERERE